ncbi:MAG TPA: AbrB/MazE/SpoVT family DNA-binding domain-containing protein [Egibacteraceae bacterium]|nr:AbrB/MazE/SpoVT family DNA-binding domain-containing protein [Egibacteraceae bacterium]
MDAPGARGIRRKVDDLGRVVIPSSIRRALGIKDGETLEFAVEGDRVILTRAADRCLFCGGEEELTSYRERAVCWSCAAALRAMDRERTGDPPPRPF